MVWLALSQPDSTWEDMLGWEARQIRSLQNREDKKHTVLLSGGGQEKDRKEMRVKLKDLGSFRSLLLTSATSVAKIVF